MGRVHILSNSGERFKDRREAGRLLGVELKKEHGLDTIVLGIPRGGIVVAVEVAKTLDAHLDIVLSRKLGAPFNPELAVGAVSEDGKVFLNENVVASLGVDDYYIQKEKAHQILEIKRRIELYRKFLPKVPLKGKIVIVTDDGVATGATMQAALWAARQEQPKKLIAALPVGPPETIEMLAGDADETLCLRAPEFFAAVGQFYLQFGQVEDEELTEVLKEEVRRKG